LPRKNCRAPGAVIVRRAGEKFSRAVVRYGQSQLCGGVFPERPRSNKNKAVSWEEKLGTFGMTFTGTLIDDLMAAVERVEQAREALFTEAAEFVTSPGESAIDQRWFASIQENAEYDPKFLGVA
jgi:hypothetical protein